MRIGMFLAAISDSNKQIQIQVRGLLAQTSGELQFYSGILYARVDEILQANKEALQQVVQNLQYEFNVFISSSKERLNDQLYYLQQSAIDHIRNEQSFIDTTIGVFFNNVHGLLSEQAPEELARQKDLLRIRLSFVLGTTRDFLNFTRQKLGLVDPTRLFERGYTISTVKGEDLNKLNEKLIDQELTTYSEKYTLISTIKAIKK